ncbi:MAG TPA: thiamine pyrophosphate-dependent dehydrogenase E1 component subunit alpha [Thermoprotei archaeon]|nr:thiamine pyrophosphate-dependent dehydrogenase E1 component subunit alpha [Thermoprotei archaeon]
MSRIVRGIDEASIEKTLGIYRIIDEEGNIVGDEPNLDGSTLYKLYEYMVRARVLDEWLLKLQRLGKVAIHAPNLGQEAIVGAVTPLKPDDWVFPSYRDLGVYLVRGMDEEEILDRALYNQDDPLKGSDFAIYGNRRFNMVPTPVPVGNQIPHAVGVAYAMKYLDRDSVTMVMFGDGATSRGDFHAGLNFAGVYRVPVIFVCENNQWAISVPFDRQTRSPSIAFRGLVYGIESIRVDGNDVLAMYKIASEAVEKARKEKEPYLIEMLTYRLGSHTTADDPSKYRSEEEVNRMMKYEPLKRYRNYLIFKGVLTDSEANELYRRYYNYIEDIAKKVLNKGGLPHDVFFHNVFEKLPWNLQDQLREFRESLELMKSLGLEVD